MVDDWKGLNKNSWLKHVFLFVAQKIMGYGFETLVFKKVISRGKFLLPVFYPFAPRHRAIPVREDIRPQTLTILIQGILHFKNPLDILGINSWLAEKTFFQAFLSTLYLFPRWDCFVSRGPL